jgi:3-oxosteroid 1-dehydrogenase
MIPTGARPREEQADLVVIGSGAAGLGAAVSAARLGARVILLEKSGQIGGTTAFSGALLWAPLHHKRDADDPPDTRERAIEYVCRNSGDCDRSLVEAYVDSAAETLAFLERHTPLKLVNIAYPDTFAEAPGGAARGRYVEPAMHSLRLAGSWRGRIRASPQMQPLTGGEVSRINMLADMRKAVKRSIPKIVWRLLRAQRGGGQALIAALLRGALDQGVDVRLQHRAAALERDAAGRVIGVECEHGGGEVRIGAKFGVVLACGGYEWSPSDIRAHVGVSLEHLPTPPLASGDNLRLAGAAGARLERLDETWHWPTGYLPGTAYEGREVGRLIIAERSMPHAIIVNRRGLRFGNESAHNFSLGMMKKDADGSLPNTPAWAIFDAQYRERYPVLFKVMPGARDPAWLVGAASLLELAARVGIDPAGLESTVARFNELARSGRDADFGRGETVYDRYFGDSTRGSHPCLGTVERAPFYALPVHPSAVGTRGGPAINADAQVLDGSGRPIPGLYAAGNASACFHGPTMIAGGATVMAALAFGRRAALHACGKAATAPARAFPRHEHA